MVFKLNKGYNPASLGELLKYHEDKVDKGVAEKEWCFTTSFHKSSSEVSSQFINHMETNNPRVYKNFFTQITANFSIEDTLDLRTKREIMDNYLKQMGYLNTPMVAYRHADKDHDHWHFICTASNFDGKLIDTRNDHHRSHLISREIEKTYGLQQLSQVTDTKSINEKSINTEKYKLYHAINSFRKKLENQLDFLREHERWLKPGFDILDRSIILESPLTRDQIRYVFEKSNQIDEFHRMEGGLKILGFIEPPVVQQIRERALKCRNESSSISGLIKKFQNEALGFYARDIKSKNEISFGLRKTKANGLSASYYPSLKELGHDFKTTELLQYFEAKKKGVEHATSKKKDLSLDDIKKYVRASIQKSSSITREWSEFESLLSEKYNIGVELKMRSNDTSSLSFTHKDHRFKSSALKLSYPLIIQKLRGNNKYTEAIRNFGNLYEQHASQNNQPKRRVTKDSTTQTQKAPKIKTREGTASASIISAANLTPNTNPEWLYKAIENYFFAEEHWSIKNKVPEEIRKVFKALDQLYKGNPNETSLSSLKNIKTEEYFKAIKALAILGFLDSSTHKSALQKFVQNSISYSGNVDQFVQTFNHNTWGYKVNFDKHNLSYEIPTNRYGKIEQPTLPSLDEVNEVMDNKVNMRQDNKNNITSQVWQILRLAIDKNEFENNLKDIFRITYKESYSTITLSKNSVRLELSKSLVDKQLAENREFKNKTLGLIPTNSPYKVRLKSDLVKTLFTMRSVFDRDAFAAELEVEQEERRKMSNGRTM